MLSGDQWIRAGMAKLLLVKDSDIRMSVIEEGLDANDRGLHIGGAFSAIIPTVALFYGKTMRVNVEDPTAPAGDIYVLSKGHSVASMAAVFADKGFFDRALLRGSRSFDSILNGHPGPVLPGVHVATGPLGQGLGAAVGFALTQKIDEAGNTFCLAGDGEMQEGAMWEAAMYAGAANLDNLCLIIDRNRGQNDMTDRNVIPMESLQDQLTAFGFYAVTVDGTQYGPLLDALNLFLRKEKGRPFAILSECGKGEGGFGKDAREHKLSVKEAFAEREMALQRNRRQQRVKNACAFLGEARRVSPAAFETLEAAAREMGYRVCVTGEVKDIASVPLTVKTRRAGERVKALGYKETELPAIRRGEFYECHKVLAQAVAAFGEDPHMVTVDSDIGTITGLHDGMVVADRNRALNVGIAEANMMNIAEAFAARGYNAWCGTFGVFFNWNVMRRIAVSQQERLESIASGGGWLAEGHGLDITFVASAANLDTQANGATHMSTDDIFVFDAVPHVKVIDTSCPRQLLGAMRWIAQGNKGLVVLRTLRPKARAIYDEDFAFEYAKGYLHLSKPEQADLFIVSSGRGVHEALAAGEMIGARGHRPTVVDMPSVDEALFGVMARSGKPIVFAEQNNAYLFKRFLQASCKMGYPVRPEGLLSLSTLDEKGEKQFIHSGSLKQYYEHFDLGAEGIARRAIAQFGL